MPYFCVEKIAHALNDREKALKGSRVAIVGVSYKAGRRRHARVAGREDHARPARPRRRARATTTSTCRSSPSSISRAPTLEEAVDGADAVVILTAHPGLDTEELVRRALAARRLPRRDARHPFPEPRSALTKAMSIASKPLSLSARPPSTLRAPRASSGPTSSSGCASSSCSSPRTTTSCSRRPSPAEAGAAAWTSSSRSRTAGQRHAIAEDVKALRGALPDDSLIAVVSADHRHGAVQSALAAGALAFVALDRLDEALVPSLAAALAGQVALPATRERQLMSQVLTAREKQVLALVVMGMSNAEIAAQALPGREHGQEPSLIGVQQARRPLAQRGRGHDPGSQLGRRPGDPHDSEPG